MSRSRLVSIRAQVQGRGSKRTRTSLRNRLADGVDGGRAAAQAAAVRIGRWWIGSPTLQPSYVLVTGDAAAS